MGLFLSPKEICPSMTGVSRKTWERMQAAGKAPKYVKVSRGRVAIRAEDLERWAADPAGWREGQ